jgi:hypothetical protein
MHRLAVSLMALVLTATPLLAGAPLKGIDVKLGRNPGGTVAARTTSGDGSFDFGILPKGRYVITLNGTAGSAVVNLKGAAEGAVHKAIAIARGGATARQAGAALEFTSDGRHPVRGHVSSGD